MKCTLCNRQAKGSEPFWTLGWEKVNLTVYKARKQDGRTTAISEVCSECMTKYNNGKPPLGLKDIQKIREQGLTEEQYYKEHKY